MYNPTQGQDFGGSQQISRGEAQSTAPESQTGSAVHDALDLGLEIGSLAIDWTSGKIDSEKFRDGAIDAVVSSLGGSSCARLGKSIGSAIGSAVGGNAGGFIGGIIGAIVGLAVDHAKKAVVEYGIKYFFGKDEDAAKAEIVIEAFHFLDLPAYESINESVVGSKFRKAALQCHPDAAKVQALTSEVEKDKAKFQWELLRHAKDVALGYLEGQDSFSARCQKMIREKYDPAKRENITFDQLKASLEDNGKFEFIDYFPDNNEILVFVLKIMNILDFLKY